MHGDGCNGERDHTPWHEAHRPPVVARVVLVSVTACDGSCDFALAVVPEKLTVDDPRLKGMYQAIGKRADRQAIGFTPLPAGPEAKDVRVQ